MDLAFRQLPLPGRHDVLLALVDDFKNRLFAISMQPDVVREIGRSDGGQSSPVSTMARCTCDKSFLPQRCSYRIMRTSRQLQNILRDIFGIFRSTQSRRHGRHIADPTLDQGFLDIGDLAAP